MQDNVKQVCIADICEIEPMFTTIEELMVDIILEIPPAFSDETNTHKIHN